MPKKNASSGGQKAPQESAEISPQDFDEDDFNPEMFGLSGQQGKFAEAVAKGKKLIDAYSDAEYEGKGNVASAAASQLLRNIKVQRAIRWLRDRRQYLMKPTCSHGLIVRWNHQKGM